MCISYINTYYMLYTYCKYIYYIYIYIFALLINPLPLQKSSNAIISPSTELMAIAEGSAKVAMAETAPAPDGGWCSFNLNKSFRYLK